MEMILNEKSFFSQILDIFAGEVFM